MAMQKISIGTMLAIAMMGVVVSALGALVATRTIPNTGTITAVGISVYSDSACTNPISSIDWGTLSPGATVARTIYIKNDGNTAVTLSMTTSDWSPSSASGYITLSWNRDGRSLSAGSVVDATFTLTVSSGISGITNFSFNIIITATA